MRIPCQCGCRTTESSLPSKGRSGQHSCCRVDPVGAAAIGGDVDHQRVDSCRGELADPVGDLVEQMFYHSQPERVHTRPVGTPLLEFVPEGFPDLGTVLTKAIGAELVDAEDPDPGAVSSLQPPGREGVVGC